MIRPDPDRGWSDRIVLVTGATGFLGARLVRTLLDRGASVVCLIRDHDPASPLWLSGDIRHVAVADGRLEHIDQVRTVVAERAVDTVFHLGAQTIVGVGRRDPLGTFESNIRGTWNLLEVCRQFADQVRRVVIASSDKAYGETPLLPYTERTPLAARHPYDVSKCCADLIAQSYWHSFQLPVAIARCGNLFGPGDLNWSRLVPGTIRSLLRGQRPIIRSDGTPVRDYLFVDDAVEGYLALADWLDADASNRDEQRAFNFSARRPMTVLEMTNHMRVAVGREDLEPTIENCTRGEIHDQHLDSSRAHRELGWRIQHEFDDVLRTTADWYRQYLHGDRCEPARVAVVETRL